MKRLYVVALALTWGAASLSPVRAQQADQFNQIAGRIEARSAGMHADDRLPVSRAVLFSGDLAAARADVETLAAAGDGGVAALTRLLGAGRAHLRANAVYGLGLVGLPSTVPALAGAAKDRVAAVRYMAAWALGNSGSAAALPALGELAADRDDAVRSMAIEASGALRDVLDAEANEDASKRLPALVALAGAEPARYRLRTYGPAAVPALIKALDSTDRGVVAGAASTLAAIGDVAALDPLYKKFTASVTANAPDLRLAQALSEFKNPAVWPFLKQLLGSTEPSAQYFALAGIGRISDAERLDVLRTFLTAEVAKNVHQAVPSTSEMTINTVAVAVELLRSVGDRSFVDLLNKIIAEAPGAEKSIVKPLAEQALAAITQRG